VHTITFHHEKKLLLSKLENKQPCHTNHKTRAMQTKSVPQHHTEMSMQLTVISSDEKVSTNYV